MTSLEESRNGCSAAVMEVSHGTRLPEGGVGQPGGFTNTRTDPRAGGVVGLPGGFGNAEAAPQRPEAPPHELVEPPRIDATDADEEDYIPRVWSPGPWSRGGRPTVLTPPVKEELCKLLSIGLSRRQAAAWLDIDHSTISRLAAKDQEFARSIARAEELAVIQPMMVLVAASRKNWRAAAWLLKQNQRRQPVLSEEEKDQKMEERVAETRRNMEYQRRVAILEEEAREAERERKRTKEQAWDRAMEAKERAERDERRRRRAERQQKQAEGTP